jgi:hypothetical protein
MKWTGIIPGGLVAIGLVANAVLVWTTDARLERQLAAIRAAGEPVTLADLAPKPIPPEQNAATYLRQAEVDVKAMEDELRAIDSHNDWRWRANGQPLPPETVKPIRVVFDAHPKVIPLLEQAATCPDYAPQLDYMFPAEQFFEKQLWPLMHHQRGCAVVLQRRVYLLVAEGNRDKAMQKAIVLLHLTHNSERDPFLVGMLVVITIRTIAVDAVNAVLQSGPISKKVRDALNVELARHESMSSYRWAVLSDRAYGIARHARLPARTFWLGARVFWNRQESAYLDAMQELLALADNPTSRQQEEKTIEKVRSAEGHLAMMIAPSDVLVAAAIRNAHHAAIRSLASVRCLRVLNALQARVPTGSDKIPKLAELGLPAETITDPFTGDPLHVKKTPQGWLVYSVGPNYRDDGGKLDVVYVDYQRNDDVGVGPPPVAKPGKE